MSFLSFFIFITTLSSHACSTPATEGLELSLEGRKFAITIDGKLKEGKEVKAVENGTCYLQFVIRNNRPLLVYVELVKWCLKASYRRVILSQDCHSNQIFAFNNHYLVDVSHGTCIGYKNGVLKLANCQSKQRIRRVSKGQCPFNESSTSIFTSLPSSSFVTTSHPLSSSSVFTSLYSSTSNYSSIEPTSSYIELSSPTSRFSTSSIFISPSSTSIAFSSFQSSIITSPTSSIQITSSRNDDPYVEIFSGPPIHGGMSQWSAWTDCSKGCGEGIQESRRYCNDPIPENGGRDCQGNVTRSKVCKLRPCPGLRMAEAGESCTSACNRDGFQCSYDVQTGETIDAFLDLSIICEEDQSQLLWANPCHPYYDLESSLCSGFVLVPEFVNCSCKPDRRQQRLCNCITAENAGFANWLQWTKCDVTCGGGVRHRERRCFNNDVCEGHLKESQSCNEIYCPVHGGFSDWSDWLPCDVTCGGGVSRRTRTCSNPVPSYGGYPCYGEYIKERICGIGNCPVNGGFTEWTKWTACDKPCNYGYRWRSRFCTNPHPLYGGLPCVGERNVSEPCNLFSCPNTHLTAILSFDYQWNQSLAYNTSAAFQRFEDELKRNLLQLYDGRVNNTYRDVSILSLRKGSVICEFKISFLSFDSLQILFLQEAIEMQHAIGSLHVKSTNYTLSAECVPNTPPESVSATTKSSTQILVTWRNKPANETELNITNYAIMYREKLSTNDFYNLIGSAQSPGLIEGLSPNTEYYIRVLSCTTEGNGVASHIVTAKTSIAAPSVAPSVLEVIPMSPFDILLDWTSIAQDKTYGKNLNYNITIKSISYPLRNFTALFQQTYLSIKNLHPFTNYLVDVCVFNEVGCGPTARAQVTTLTSAPSQPPPNFTVSSMISDIAIETKWLPIPQIHVNGDLKHYELAYYRISNNKMKTSDIQWQHLTVHPALSEARIEGLIPGYKYNLQIRAVNQYDGGVYSSQLKSETCKCPSVIKASYSEMKPYTYRDEHAQLNGIFPKLLEKVILKSCGTCGVNEEPPSSDYIRDGSGYWASKRSFYDVIESIGDTAQLNFPIIGRSEMVDYLGYAYVPLIDYPGMAVIVINDALSLRLSKMAHSLIKLWPILVMNILLISVSGITIATVDGEGSFLEHRNYVKRALTGMYWAFVTMGTLGYGDITPRTNIGRCFAIVWILVSLISMSVLTGALTSSFNAVYQEDDFKIYGSKVGALEQSKEYSIGVLRNGKVNQDSQYFTIEELVTALKSREVQAVLLDVHTAAARWSMFKDKDIRIDSIVQYPASYGIVLSGTLRFAQEDFRQIIKDMSNEIAYTVKLFTEELEDIGAAPPMVSLLDKDSEFVRLLIICGSSIVVSCWLLNVLYKILKRLCKRINKGSKLPSKERVDTETKPPLETACELQRSTELLLTTLKQTLRILEDKHAKERIKLGMCKKRKDYKPPGVKTENV